MYENHLPTHITCGQLDTCRWRPPGHRKISALTNGRTLVKQKGAHYPAKPAVPNLSTTVKVIKGQQNIIFFGINKPLRAPYLLLLHTYLIAIFKDISYEHG